jgi:ATP-dependent DNA helicase Q1
VDAELVSLNEQISSLIALRDSLLATRKTLLSKAHTTAPISTNNPMHTSKRVYKDYFNSSQFGWSQTLRAKMKQVWGIDTFRLSQEGVCNAMMDGRDVFCLMPTGGGLYFP